MFIAAEREKYPTYLEELHTCRTIKDCPYYFQVCCKMNNKRKWEQNKAEKGICMDPNRCYEQPGGFGEVTIICQ